MQSDDSHSQVAQSQPLSETLTPATTETPAKDASVEGGATSVREDKPANGAVQPDAPTVATPQKPAAETPATSRETVTLTVDFHTAVDYGILQDARYKGVLPESGQLLSAVCVGMQAGDSVTKVLKETLKANKLTYQITSNGYIRSIGGLGEMDCGPQSGWVYKVNGEFPNVSGKYYKLSPGDSIEILYTCEKGDVGQLAF